MVLLLATGLTACSLFSSDEEEVRTPKPLQALEQREDSVQLAKVWSKNIGEGVGDRFEQLTPAIQGDVIYITDARGQVMALSRENGREIWKRQLKVRVGAGVTTGVNQVLLGTLDGEVIALNQETGEDLWRARVSSEILSSPVTDGAYVAVHSIDDRLTVLNARTGDLVWRQDVLQPALTLRGSSEPVIVRDAVIAGFSSGEAKAFRLTDGAPLWSSRVAVPTGSTELERMVDIKGAPLVIGDSLFLASFQGNIVGLDLYSGRARWSKEVSSYKPIAEGFGALYVTDENDYISSVDQRTGASSWRQEALEYRRATAPATFGSYVAVGDLDGYVHLLSQVDGSFAGRFKATSKALTARPIVSGDLMLVMSSSGELVAIRQR